MMDLQCEIDLLASSQLSFTVHSYVFMKCIFFYSRKDGVFSHIATKKKRDITDHFAKPHAFFHVKWKQSISFKVH